MKNKIFLIIILTMISFKSMAQLKPISERVFLYQLGIVENFINTGYSSEDDCSLNKAVTFLETLTEIHSEGIGDITAFHYTPTKKNLNDWKKWFKKNKSRLRWDMQSHSMSLE